MRPNTKIIATHTYMNSDNYGSVLQSFALNYKLRRLGYNAFVIDYKKPEVSELYQLFKPNSSVYNVLSNIYSLLHFKELREKQIEFENFRNHFIKKSETQYRSYKQLKDNPPEADCYICGSDQIWNTEIVDFDDSYLLDFVRSGKRISYAASGITEKTPECGINHILKHIDTFQAVSVRENIGVIRLAGRTSNPVVRVVDPVFLLTADEWRELILQQDGVENNRKPYMFCYFAGGVSKSFDEYTSHLAKEKGLERLLIMPEWRNIIRGGRKYYQVGPLEFLTLLNSAGLVCTNSFHGTALSIILNKPFLVGLHIPFSENRITTLLTLCNLSEREIDPVNKKLMSNVMSVDFELANKIINLKSEESISWLMKAIEE